MEKFEDYVTDQFPLRDQWIQLKALSERALGKQENNGVYFCDDATLISRFDAPDAKRLENNAKYVLRPKVIGLKSGKTYDLSQIENASIIIL